MSNTPFYHVWANIRIRCNNKKHKEYKNYGGRGITYHPRWEKFTNFYKDMHQTYKSGLSIDRINNSKSYSKSNCRWADYKMQNRNTRKNVIYKGELAIDASRRLSGGTHLVNLRLYYGWTKKEAFTRPVGNYKNRNINFKN